jgi:chemotaxis protein histidine kinase CheA
MDFQNDPELEKLFRDELDERSSALVSGARTMAGGELTNELAGRMLREGHTIKGTGRVMGYEAIARGGETSELVWRWIQQGDLAPSSMLARTLEHLAQAIPGALSGGDAEVSVAIDTVRAVVADPALVDQLPQPLTIDIDEPRGSAAVAGAEEGTTIEVDVTAAVDEEDADALPEAPAAAPSIDDLDLHDIADVAATLERIEREISDADPSHDNATPSEGEAPETQDEATQEPSPAPEEHQDGPAPEPVSAEPVAPEAAAPEPVAAEPVAPETPSPAPKADERDRTEPAAGAPDDDGPLVFEPGPDGKLPTPVITYEIVTSAFADVSSPPAPSSAPDEPPSLSVVNTTSSVLDAGNEAVYDLGGLLGAVETWATEESVPVNAGRLFRLINDVAALRIDLDSSVALAAHLLTSADGLSTSTLEGSLESLEAIRRAAVRLQGAALGLTTMPLATVTVTLPQLTKYLAKKVDRDVELVIEGEDTAVDRQLVDRIGEVIRQLVVNSVAHGIEGPDVRTAAGKPPYGTVRVSISRDDQHVQIVVTDDGAGIDWNSVRDAARDRGLVSDDPSTEELRSVLFSQGFSTNPGQTEFTGDGEGLARVTDIVEQVFGTMNLDSTPGRGTTFVVTMPAHRALQRAQVFVAGGRSWGIPESSVVAVKGLPEVSISVTPRGSFVSFGDKSVPYSSFSNVVGLDVEGLPSQVMIIQSPTGRIALAVDEVGELTEVATKDLSPLLSGSSSVVSGVALLGSDDTVMLVDAGRLAEKMREIEVRPEGPVHTVLVVDDSQGVRQVVSGVLASHGFSTLSAGSVSDALSVLSRHKVDALVVDFSMPRADGVALIHMVRQRYGGIPVVMLSGVASEEDRSRAERAGADAFYDKADFAKGALVDKLRELIDSEPSGAEAGIAS